MEGYSRVRWAWAVLSLGLSIACTMAWLGCAGPRFRCAYLPMTTPAIEGMGEVEGSVSLEDVDTDSPIVVTLVPKGPGPCLRAEVGADGHFSFHRVSVDRYLLVAGRELCETQHREVIVLSGHVTNVSIRLRCQCVIATAPVKLPNDMQGSPTGTILER